jgi:hypothetical protein
MSGILLYARLVAATAVVLAPGWLLARALGVSGVAATLGWSLTLLFGALTVTFALQASLTVAMILLAAAAVAALVALLARGTRVRSGAPGQGWVWAAGAVLGILLWRVGRDVEGDGLFHLARARKLLELDALDLDRVSEFVDGSLHPGYAFPLWHGFIALVAKVGGVDPEQVVVHLPSVLAVLALVVAYEAGWALFRRTWAAGAVVGAQAGMICFAPGHGGAYTVLSLPATSSRQLLVPAALALAFEAIRRPSAALYASTAAAGFALAVVHPTYAIFLWLPFGGFLVVRWLWARRDVRTGLAALCALLVPAALFMLWLVPVVADTASVSPDSREVARALAHYAGQLDVRSETSYSLAPEVFTRSGAVAVAAILLFPLACFAARRRWAAYVAGGSLAVLTVMLVPFLFVSLADLVSISQARRAAGFLPFAFAFAGGLGVLSRLLGPFLPPLALVSGIVLQVLYPGDFDYLLEDGAPGALVWIALAAGVVGLVVGLVRRGETLEAPAGVAAALFLLPVIAVGLARWTPVEAPPGTALSPGLVRVLRTEVAPGAVVFSDPETSFRLAARAPVYIANAPPGHVADTLANRPYERARDARRFIATGDLSIPESYGAEYIVVDRRRQPEPLDLQVLFRDSRFTVYRLPSDRS